MSAPEDERECPADGCGLLMVARGQSTIQPTILFDAGLGATALEEVLRVEGDRLPAAWPRHARTPLSLRPPCMDRGHGGVEAEGPVEGKGRPVAVCGNRGGPTGGGMVGVSTGGTMASPSTPPRRMNSTSLRSCGVAAWRSRGRPRARAVEDTARPPSEGSSGQGHRQVQWKAGEASARRWPPHGSRRERRPCGRPHRGQGRAGRRPGEGIRTEAPATSPIRHASSTLRRTCSGPVSRRGRRSSRQGRARSSG